MASADASISLVSEVSGNTCEMLPSPSVSVPADQLIRSFTPSAYMCEPRPQARSRMEPLRLFNAVVALSTPDCRTSCACRVMLPRSACTVPVLTTS
ncbi:hypothetical protein D3C86_1265970 [compost metagenome]